MDFTPENEAFKTLKAGDGYNFEHNYGHGKNHLADVFPTLAILALLMDQVQLHCCTLFRKARDYQERLLYLREAMRELFKRSRIRDWQTFYLAMSREIEQPELAELFSNGP